MADISTLRCAVCHALLAEHIEGDYVVRCSRCRYEHRTRVHFAVQVPLRCDACNALLAEHAASVVVVTCRRCKHTNTRASSEAARKKKR